jgi:hypothetical protein
MKRVLLLLLSLTFFACATAQRTVVDVTDQPAKDSWRVALRFAKPVERVDFVRNREGAFRAAS